MHFLGDIHGDFYCIERFCRKNKEKKKINLIQVGDFGAGFDFNIPGQFMIKMDSLNGILAEYNITLYVLRGNHDDPQYFTGTYENFWSNIKLMPDYSVVEIEGKRVLMVGGAISIDRLGRAEGKSWWSDEVFVLDEEKLKWSEKQKDNKIPVSLDDVYDIISDMTGVPITKLDTKETKKLLELENILSSKVIGQDEAVKTISKAIRRNRVGIKEANKPIGSFIFIGSTGVGKTYLAKSIAETLFGDPDKIIRVDMSEYMEKHNVSKLIGSPPGYVGYDEGGQLTEKIKNNPFSVVLFDEIEKAHKDVFNILLQILDEGHLTDSFGRKINFTNTIVIMTSNVGAKRVSDLGAGVGFKTSSSEEQQYEVRKTMIQKALKQQFNPEFLNRIDDIILFNSLNDETLRKIIGIEVNNLNKRLINKNYKINFDKTVINRIYELNSQEEYGARPLKRIIQNLCEDFLSEEILKGTILENVQYTLKYKDENLLISKK